MLFIFIEIEIIKTFLIHYYLHKKEIKLKEYEG
jgi:hypothetical protein